jgi:hypothetical protein
MLEELIKLESLVRTPADRAVPQGTQLTHEEGELLRTDGLFLRRLSITTRFLYGTCSTGRRQDRSSFAIPAQAHT